MKAVFGHIVQSGHPGRWKSWAVPELNGEAYLQPIAPPGFLEVCVLNCQDPGKFGPLEAQCLPSKWNPTELP